MYIIAYSAFVVHNIFYYEEPRATVNELVYVPKSKRNKIWKRILPTKTWLNKKITLIAETVSKKLFMYERRKKLKRVYTQTCRIQYCHKNTAIMLFAVIAMRASGMQENKNEIFFDTDSEPIGIDNRCTGCISHRIEDFDGPLTESHRTIKGFGGSRTTNVKIGTITWKWLDDDGLSHKFVIPKSFYVPDGNVRLISPQHWAQAQKEKNNGIGSETLHDSVTLFWNGRKNKLTVPLGKTDNVATFFIAPGYRKFEAFCAKAEMDYAQEQLDPIIADETLVVSDDEDDIKNESINSSLMDPKREDWSHPVDTIFDFDLNATKKRDIPNVIEDEEDHQATSNTAELLRYHHKFGHISFRRLQEMAKLGTIPKKLAKCQIPACSACLYSKAIKRKWRSRTPNNQEDSNKPTSPGERVSVDQLVSPTPGLIAQMTGFLTMKRYKYATVYVDQASRLSFVWLQKTATADETLLGKEAFQQYAKDRGVKVLGYHADNGIFKAHKWVNACKSEGQGLTFAGVNAHHQNGIAERKIRSLQELARTMLVHANKRWPKAITANLWPYAIRMANDVSNETPLMQDPAKRTAQQLFS